jgi:site-specific DNA-methyltransferase (adenine-specific)
MKPYYEDSAVTIYHGDCRDIMPELRKADVVLTDPPYGVGLAEWDRYPTQRELDEFIRVSSGKVAMFGAAPPHCIVALTLLKPLYDRIFIWHNTFTLTNSDGSFWQWQPIYTWGKCFKNLGRDIITFPATDAPKRWHPAQKSEKLMRFLIQATEGTILDAFMGSGTTLRAAKDLGRKAIGIEIEERYCEIAAKRMAQEILPLFGSHAEKKDESENGEDGAEEEEPELQGAVVHAVK